MSILQYHVAIRKVHYNSWPTTCRISIAQIVNLNFYMIGGDSLTQLEHIESSRTIGGHSRPASTDLAPFSSSIRARPHKRRSLQYKSAKVSTRPRTISLVPGHN